MALRRAGCARLGIDRVWWAEERGVWEGSRALEASGSVSALMKAVYPENCSFEKRSAEHLAYNARCMVGVGYWEW